MSHIPRATHIERSGHSARAAHIAKVEDLVRRNELTLREAQRREIAGQVEQFLQHGGHIDVLQSPLREAGTPIGRVWWDAAGESIVRS